MDLISNVVIHGQPYTVTVADIGREHMGLFCSETQTITIHSVCNVPYRVLAHELAHGGLFESGLSELLTDAQQEAICVAMEQTFGPILKELAERCQNKSGL